MIKISWHPLGWCLHTLSLPRPEQGTRSSGEGPFQRSFSMPMMGVRGKVLLFLPVSLVSQVTQETRAELPDWGQPLFQILGPGWATWEPGSHRRALGCVSARRRRVRGRRDKRVTAS